MKCNQCRFWSEMMAHVDNGAIKAMCLAEGGDFKGEFVSENSSCSGYKESYYGAIDAPPNYGEYIVEAYVKEEGKDAIKAA